MFRKCEVTNITASNHEVENTKMRKRMHQTVTDSIVQEKRDDVPEMAILTPVMFKGVSSSPKTQAETVMVATSFAIPAIDMGTTPMRWMMLQESLRPHNPFNSFGSVWGSEWQGLDVWFECRARTRPRIRQVVCDASRGH